MEFLLNKDALKGLSETDQAEVKDRALGQFLLGSIFGGQGIASGYQAVQNIIPSLQQQRQQQGLLQEVSKIQEKYFPNEQQEQRQALNANLGRERLSSSPYSLSTSLGLPQENVQPQATSQPIDFNAAYKDVARLSTNPNATKLLPGITDAFKNLQPRVQGDLILNANQEVIRGLPTQKEGITSQYNPLIGGFSAAPVQNYLASKIQTSMPEVSTNTMLVPVQGGGFTQVAIPGSEESVAAIEASKARGQAAGQVEKVYNSATGRTEFQSRANLLGQNPFTQTTAGQMTNTGGLRVGPSGGFAAEPSASEKTFNETADARFKDFSKKSIEASDTASGRKLAAQQLYDLSTRINNNKLTGIQAGVYGYMNAIPGIGKMFEQDITDVTQMNQAIATAQLEKTAQQKGAASNLDQQVIARGYSTLTDPATATRLLAAQELALADKDIARNQFVEAYRGDPAKIGTAWDKSPENKPIFEHPKFKQFLNEQVNANPSAPVLPAGFNLVQGKSGKYGVKRPDGTVMPLGQ